MSGCSLSYLNQVLAAAYFPKTIDTYNNFETIEQIGRIGQAAILRVGRGILRNVPIPTRTKEDLFDVDGKAGAKRLDGVDLNTTVDLGS